MDGLETEMTPTAHWVVFTDRLAGRITLLGQHSSPGGYDVVELDESIGDESVRVWRNSDGDLVAAEATIDAVADNAVDQIPAFRAAVDRLCHVAGAEREWFEPHNLIRYIPDDDNGRVSFLTYGTGRPRTTSELAADADADFLSALNRVRANQARKDAERPQSTDTTGL